MTDQTVATRAPGIPEASFPAPARTLCLQVRENHASDHVDGGQVVFQLARPPIDPVTGQLLAPAQRVHAPVEGDAHEEGEDVPEARYPSPTFVLYAAIQRNQAAEVADGGLLHFTLVKGGQPAHLTSGDAVLSAAHNALLHQYPWRTRQSKASRVFRLTLFESTTGYVDTVHAAPDHAERCVDARFVLAFDDDAPMHAWPWKTAAARRSRYYLLTIEEVTIADLPPKLDELATLEAGPGDAPLPAPDPVRLIAPPDPAAGDESLPLT